MLKVIDQYITLKDEDYITEEEYQKGRSLINAAINLLNGYINYLGKAKRNSN